MTTYIEVTVVAADSHGNRDTMDVKVTVDQRGRGWSGHAVADSAACWSPGDGQPDRP